MCLVAISINNFMGVKSTKKFYFVTTRNMVDYVSVLSSVNNSGGERVSNVQ